jgi:hypothetical protein
VKLEIDLDLSADQDAGLSSLLATLPAQVKTSFGTNDALMSCVARCAAMDAAQWLAEGPPTTVAAWREQRLVTITGGVLGGGVPNEAFVAELFALTSGEARSLIRRTLARHRRRMSGTVRESLIRAVRNATSNSKKKPDRYYLTMEESVLRYAESLVRGAPGVLQPIKRRTEGVDRFEIPAESMRAIVAGLGMQMTEVGCAR